MDDRFQVRCPLRRPGPRQRRVRGRRQQDGPDLVVHVPVPGRCVGSASLRPILRNQDSQRSSIKI